MGGKKSVIQVAYEDVEACTERVQDLMYILHIGSDDVVDIDLLTKTLDIEKDKLELYKVKLHIAETFMKDMSEIRGAGDGATEYAESFLTSTRTRMRRGLQYFREALKPWEFAFVNEKDFCDYCSMKSSSKTLVVSCADPITDALVTICNKCHLERSEGISVTV